MNNFLGSTPFLIEAEINKKACKKIAKIAKRMGSVFAFYGNFCCTIFNDEFARDLVWDWSLRFASETLERTSLILLWMMSGLE